MPRCPRCLRTPSYKLHFVYIAFFCCQPTEQHSQPGVRAASSHLLANYLECLLSVHFAHPTVRAARMLSTHFQVPIYLCCFPSYFSMPLRQSLRFFLLSIVRNQYAFPIHCSGASAFSAVIVTGPESSVGHETLLSSCLCLNLTPGAHLLLKGARQILGRIIAHRPRKEKTGKGSKCTSKCRNRLSHSKIVRTLVLLLLSSVLSSVFLIEFFPILLSLSLYTTLVFCLPPLLPSTSAVFFSILSFKFSSSSIALISVT